jgi:hypothetical protein
MQTYYTILVRLSPNKIIVLAVPDHIQSIKRSGNRQHTLTKSCPNG